MASKPTNFDAFATAAAAAAAEFRENLSSLRDEIVQVKHERDHVACLPATLQTAQERIASWAESTKKHSDELGGLAWMFVDPESRFRSPSLTQHFQETVVRYIVPLVAEQLSRDCAALLDGAKTISEDDRARQLRTLDQRLHRLELDEEHLLRAAEAHGLHAPRRRDASRSAIDADDEELVVPLEHLEHFHAVTAAGGDH